MAASDIVVKVLTDTTQFASGLKTASGEADTFKSKLGGVAKAAGAMALATGAAVGAAFLKGSIDEAREAQKVMAQTEAGIKSTGGAANVTAGHVENLAGKLSKMAGVDDEVIQTGANMLLTFTNVKNAAGAGNNVFDKATEAAVNLSAKGFGSVESASVMLGKALNDPLKGISALGRAGVTFTAQQKEQIKTLTETGDVLGAQKIILGEVEKQVGGAAKAAADPMDKLKVSVGNLEESAGTLLLPVLDKLATVLGSVADFTERNMNVIGPLVAVLAPLAAIIATIVAVTKIWTAVQTAFNIVMAANPIVLIILGIAALIAAIVLLYTKCEWFRDAIAAVWNALAVGFNFVLDVIKGVFNWVSNNWPLLLAILTGPIGLAVLFIVKNWDTITAVFQKVLDWIKSTWSTVYHFIVDPIANAVDKMIGFGKSIITGLWDGIKSMAGWITDKVKGLAKTILGPFAKVLGIKSPSTVFAGYGRDIVRGLAGGITSNSSLAQRSIADLGRSLAGPNLTGSSVAAAGGASVASSSPNVTLNLTASGVDPYRLGKVVLDEAAWALRSSGR
jgi:phage-related protein